LAIRNIICIAIDRLHAAYLGPYGNTWVETPTLNEFAAKAFLLDRAVTDSPQLAVSCRSFWQGVHALCPSDRVAQRASLVELLARAGYQATLVTDDSAVANHPLAVAFAECDLVTPSSGAKIAEHPDDTDLAVLFQTATERISAAKSPFVTWIHASALGRRWDAPSEYGARYADEDDPTPTDSAAIPDRMLPESFDPDEVTAVTHAYAGQVTLLDELLGPFIEAIDAAHNPDETVIALVSPRGIALGEHHRLGPCDDALYSDVVHVPCMIRVPAAMKLAGRSQAIVQSADVPATLLELCGLDADWKSPLAGYGRSLLPLARNEQPDGFDRACAVGAADKTIVVPNWSLRISNPEASAAAKIAIGDTAAVARRELFVKPDDWFEVNEVSDRCSEIAEFLGVELLLFEQHCAMGDTAMLAKLPEELTSAFI
jgi:membrane-anchored protein YejM (alkaline phosphatase superfamily)